MQYFAWGINKPDVTDKRTALIRTHWDFIAQYDDVLIARGPLMDDGDLSKVIGSIHIADLPDDAAAEKFVHDEPFAKAGLFDRIVLKRFELELDRTQFEFTRNPNSPQFFVYRPSDTKPGVPSANLKLLHDVYVSDFDTNLVCHGALLSDEGNWNGNVFFLEFPTADDVSSFLRNDPYNNANIYDYTEVHRWTMGGAENLNAAGALS